MGLIKSKEEQFCQYLLNMDKGAVLGLAHLMKVNLMEEDPEDNTKKILRQAEAIIIDMCDTFLAYNREQRKNLLKLMSKAQGKLEFKECTNAATEEVDNGATTENC